MYLSRGRLCGDSDLEEISVIDKHRILKGEKRRNETQRAIDQAWEFNPANATQTNKNI